MNYQSKARALRAAVLALSIFASAVFLSGCGREADQAPPTELMLADEQATVPETTIPQEYNGTYYVPKEGLQTILIMGLDKYERPEATIAYTNTMQSDFLLLVVIDEDAGVCKLLPTHIGGLLRAGRCTVKVLETKDQWFGVTYREDKPAVVESFRKLISDGVYQEALYGDL